MVLGKQYMLSKWQIASQFRNCLCPKSLKFYSEKIYLLVQYILKLNNIQNVCLALVITVKHKTQNFIVQKFFGYKQQKWTKVENELLEGVIYPQKPWKDQESGSSGSLNRLFFSSSGFCCYNNSIPIVSVILSLMIQIPNI